MFAWLLIPIYERIDALVERHGDFDTLQRFRLSVANYYLKHDRNLTEAFRLEKLVGA